MMERGFVLGILVYVVVRAAVIEAHRRWWSVNLKGRVGQNVRYW